MFISYWAINRIIKIHVHFVQNSWKKRSDWLSAQDVLRQTIFSHFKCSKYLISRGNFFLSKEWFSQKKYINGKISKNELKVTFYSIGSIFPKMISPIFKRVRTIKYHNGHITCKCNHFERYGIPRWHQWNVLFSFPRYDEPSHHDISDCNWNKYIFYSIVDKDASDKYKNIALLMKN